MNVNHTLYYGIINKELKMDYILMDESNAQFPLIKQTMKGNIQIRPSFGISISEGFNKSKIFIKTSSYFHFITLLDKTIKLISDNLYEIFPNINSMEYSIDSKVMERFQTEKAITVCDMTMFPSIFVNETNECFPAIQINTQKGYVKVPFEDCIGINKLLEIFDPFSFEINMLRIMGKLK